MKYSKFRKLYLFLILLFSLHYAFPQSPFIYEFNTHGELISGPPPILLGTDNIDVRIHFNVALFRSQVDSIRLNVLKAKIYWASIQKKYGAGEDSSWINKVETLKEDLTHFEKVLKGKTDQELLDEHAAWKQDKSYTYTYTPAPAEVVDLLLKQNTLAAKCNKLNCFEWLPLQLKYSEDCGWYFCLQTLYKPVFDLQLNLFQMDPVKKTMIWWYNQKIGNFPYEEFSLFEKSRQNNDPLFSKLKAYVTNRVKIKSDIEDTCKEKTTLNKFIVGLDTSDFKMARNILNDKINDLRDWILSFVWMNPGGKPQINPFDFTNPNIYRNLDKPKEADDTLDLHVRKGLDTLLNQEKMSFKDYLEVVRVLYKRDSIKNKLDSIASSDKKQFNGNASQNQAANVLNLWYIQQTATLINIVRTPLSPPQDSLHIRNYYFNRRPDKRNFAYDYPDNEKLVIALHNLPGYSGSIVVEQKSKSDEKVQITEDLDGEWPTDGIVKGITGFRAASFTTSANKSTHDLNGFLWKGSAETIVDTQKTQKPKAIKKPKPPVSCSSDYLRLIQNLKNEYIKYIILDSLYDLSQSPPLALQNMSNDSPRMVTDIRFPDGSMKPPYQYGYVLSVKDTSKIPTLINPIDSSGYRIGKRRFVELGLGVAYSFTSVRQVGVDTTSGGFQPNSSEDKIQFVVGLKFHFLRKIYWGNNQFAFSKKSLNDGTWKERMFGFVGVSIPQPLNNIYTGIGIDLVPGLSINTGAQWYSYKNYSVNNNVVLKTTTVFRPAFYVALTADPLLVVNLITAFFN